jgi:hypothetical protein
VPPSGTGRSPCRASPSTAHAGPGGGGGTCTQQSRSTPSSAPRAPPHRLSFCPVDRAAAWRRNSVRSGFSCAPAAGRPPRPRGRVRSNPTPTGPGPGLSDQQDGNGVVAHRGAYPPHGALSASWTDASQWLCLAASKRTDRRRAGARRPPVNATAGWRTVRAVHGGVGGHGAALAGERAPAWRLDLTPVPPAPSSGERDSHLERSWGPCAYPCQHGRPSQ